MSCCFAPDLSAGVCVKRYGPRLPIKHDYFDKDLSRKGAAPAPRSGYQNRLAGLPS